MNFIIMIVIIMEMTASLLNQYMVAAGNVVLLQIDIGGDLRISIIHLIRNFLSILLKYVKLITIIKTKIS